MPAISSARAANVATCVWTKLYSEIVSWISCVYECRPCHDGSYLSWSLNHLYRPWAACCWWSVEAQASCYTYINFGCRRSGSPTLHSGSFIDLREIFKCAHLKFTVYGHKQTNTYVRIHTQVSNAVSLVWVSLRLVPNSHMYPPLVWLFVFCLFGWLVFFLFVCLFGWFLFVCFVCLFVCLVGFYLFVFVWLVFVCLFVCLFKTLVKVSKNVFLHD